MINSEQIQALKAAAEKATPGEWKAEWYDDERGYVTWFIDLERQRAAFFLSDSGPELNGYGEPTDFDKADCNFIAAANPAAILSLLAEREADKALIAEQAKRIAELEAALKAAEINEIDARCHIAELQDRTLKFPPAVPVANWMVGIDVYDADLVRALLSAAGITLVVGE